MDRLNLVFSSCPPSDNRQHSLAVSYRTRARLAREFSQLQYIEVVRRLSQDPSFGKAAEAQIVGRELLGLELQFIDEQIQGIIADSGKTSSDAGGHTL